MWDMSLLNAYLWSLAYLSLNSLYTLGNLYAGNEITETWAIYPYYGYIQKASCLIEFDLCHSMSCFCHK